MQNLLRWTLDAIRDDEADMSWMEERRFDWVPVIQNGLSHVLNGRTIILVTDYDRKWFSQYVINSLNTATTDRPLIPIMDIETIYPHFDGIRTAEQFQMLEDMLSLSFSGGYFFWYVGKASDKRREIASREDDNFLWVFDEHVQNAFTLHSYDKLLDIKLLHLYRLFEKTLGASLFGEIDLEA
jgi:hypothetical protein